MPVLTETEARALVARAFVNAGVTPPDMAEAAAHHLVLTEMMGITTHGLARVGSYIGRIAAGGIDPAALPEVTELAPALLQMDGRDALGASVAQIATLRTMKAARETGIAACFVRRGTHFGAVAPCLWIAAEAGFASFITANSALVGADPRAAVAVVEMLLELGVVSDEDVLLADPGPHVPPEVSGARRILDVGLGDVVDRLGFGRDRMNGLHQRRPSVAKLERLEVDEHAAHLDHLGKLVLGDARRLVVDDAGDARPGLGLGVVKGQLLIHQVFPFWGWGGRSGFKPPKSEGAAQNARFPQISQVARVNSSTRIGPLPCARPQGSQTQLVISCTRARARPWCASPCGRPGRPR
jgi:hypothetical protein